MPNPTNRTKAVVTTTAAAVLAFELWTYYNRDKRDTISAAVWDQCDRTPVFIALANFAGGALFSHFFGWTRTKDPS